MKLIKSHSDENFCKGFDMYSIYKIISDSDDFDDLFKQECLNELNKNRLWNILKIYSLTNLLEHLLTDKIREEFKNFDSGKQVEIKEKIIKKIARFRNKDEEEAREIINCELSGFGTENLITTPILQYIGGYTFGDLISFASNNFSIKEEIILKLRDFKENRNFVIHNSTSSWDDIDKHLENGIKIGKELLKKKILKI